jgi:hypothetical protein
MQKKILLDGCSFTYGLNLAQEETLEHHFIELGYNVLNLSRPGKSNHAISMDIYNNIDQVDIVVAGWTFSSRWYIQYHHQHIDFLASRAYLELLDLRDAELIEQSYQDLHKSFYSMFDQTYWNQYSNMLIDTASCLVKCADKKAVWFSWEPRKTQSSVYYPHVPVKHRLPCGHLNANGTTFLFNNLIELIEQ